MQYLKVAVGIYSFTSADGESRPVALEWEDGRIYRIEKIISKRRMPPEHVGAVSSLRYDVVIDGKNKTLYFEKYKNVWFVEKRLQNY